MVKALLYMLIAGMVTLVGCSQASTTLPDDSSAIAPRESEGAENNRWEWGTWEFSVSADHSQIETVPIRETSLHYNVTMFVEDKPCFTCLNFGPVQHQPDGTLKIDITLRHPFPGCPQFTGFDVRGTVVFPATHFWAVPGALYDAKKPWKVIYGSNASSDPGIPAYFSHSSEGGAMVLNPTGYSFYLFPGMKSLGYDSPINKYWKGKYATETEELNSTVNPFIEFHSQEERRMFLPWAEVTRTYHIKPPVGAFKLGYIVDASWAPPTTTPVTDPAVDFPYYANAEDPINVELEQIAPLRNNVVDYNVVRWRLYHRLGDKTYFAYAINPDIKLANPPDQDSGPSVLRMDPGDQVFINEYTAEVYLKPGYGGLVDNPAGKYLFLFSCRILADQEPDLIHESAYYDNSIGFQLVELELVE